MRKLLLLLCLIGSTYASKPDSSNFWIFLAGGQSNMIGRAPLSAIDSVVDSRVWVLDSTAQWIQTGDPIGIHSPNSLTSAVKLGPSYWCARRLVRYFPRRHIGIIIAGSGGRSIGDWQKGDISYDTLVNRAIVQNDSGIIKGILFMQGEAEAGSTEALANSWIDSCVKMVDSMRSDLGINDLPIVAGQVGQFLTGAYRDNVNDQIALIPDSISGSKYISSLGLDSTDAYHYNDTAQHELGKRMADSLAAIIGGGGSMWFGDYTGNNTGIQWHNSSLTLADFEPDSLIALWDFNSGSGDSIYDLTDNNNNGFIVGATWQTSKTGFDKCIEFDKDNSDYISIVTSPSLNFSSASFSWACWINIGENADNQNIWGTRDATDNPLIFVRIYDAAGNMLFYVTDSDGNIASATGLTDLTSTGWHHIAGTVSPTEVIIYVDGKIDGRGSAAGLNGNLSSDGFYYIGAGPPTHNYDYVEGKVDYLGFWKTDLTYKQIMNLNRDGTRWNLERRIE